MVDKKVVCTKGFMLRAFEMVLALAGMIIMLTAVGETKCTETNAGPGSENCKTEMPFSNFASCVFYVVVAAFTVFWCFLLVLAHLYTYRAQPEFCQRNGETIEYVSDFVLCILNLVGYIYMAVELNQAKADEEQGKTVMQLSSDATKFGVAMGSAFILSIFFGMSLAHNLKLSTRKDNLPPKQELPAVAQASQV